MSRNENYGKYLRELNMIYFDAIELKNLYKNDKRLKLNLEIEKRNTSYQDLCGDKNKMIVFHRQSLYKFLRWRENKLSPPSPERDHTWVSLRVDTLSGFFLASYFFAG